MAHCPPGRAGVREICWRVVELCWVMGKGDGQGGAGREFYSPKAVLGYCGSEQADAGGVACQARAGLALGGPNLSISKRHVLIL